MTVNATINAPLAVPRSIDREVTHLSKRRSKPIMIVFWTATALFCLEMGFTAYYILGPGGVEAIGRLGFPDYFRMELALMKLLGVVLLLAPVPARLKEWVYAGFAINLASALFAHFSTSDVAASFVPSTITSVLWGLSYLCWHRLQTTPASV